MSFNSNTSAPKIAGIDMIKEYFTAKLRLNPLNRHAVIVVPDRDKPGVLQSLCSDTDPECIGIGNTFRYFFTIFGMICYEKAGLLSRSSRCRVRSKSLMQLSAFLPAT